MLFTCVGLHHLIMIVHLHAHVLHSCMATVVDANIYLYVNTALVHKIIIVVNGTYIYTKWALHCLIIRSKG